MTVHLLTRGDRIVAVCPTRDDAAALATDGLVVTGPVRLYGATALTVRALLEGQAGQDGR